METNRFLCPVFDDTIYPIKFLDLFLFRLDRKLKLSNMCVCIDYAFGDISQKGVECNSLQKLKELMLLFNAYVNVSSYNTSIKIKQLFTIDD